VTVRDERGLLYLATGDECRRLDRHTIDVLGLPGRVLMELAGQGAAELIRQRTGGQPGRAVVLCGGGNNGGDGYVVARSLADSGWSVQCIALKATDALNGDAAANHGLFEALGGAVRVRAEMDQDSITHALSRATVIVDAIFGTGLSRAIEGDAAEWIDQANAETEAFRVALDVPSGVCADTGRTLGHPFRADLTASFGLAKLGLVQYPGAEFAGEVQVVPIAFPTRVIGEASLAWRLLDAAAVAQRLPARVTRGHKGSFGHVGVVGGFAGMGGAAVLTGHGALRSGCGLVTWNGPAAPDLVERPAELMIHDVATGLDPRSDVLAVGPGLGRGPGAPGALEAACASGRQLVLDADALNILAEASNPAWPEQAVLTPHPAEAARMLGTSTDAIQANRPGALRQLIDLTGCVVVLKGARSLVGGPGTPGVVVPGNAPALAVAGSGDVLTGVLAGLLAQGASTLDAALCASWLHAAAGRRLGDGRANRGVLASEVADVIPTVVDELLKGWLV